MQDTKIQEHSEKNIKHQKFLNLGDNGMSSNLNLAESAAAASTFPTRVENLVFGPQLPQAGLGRATGATGGLGRTTGGLRQGRAQQGVQGRRQGGRRQDG